jgi:hypothetical protein
VTDRATTTTSLQQLSGKRDSNPRPQPWQGCALPTELFPQHRLQPHLLGRNARPVVTLNLQLTCAPHRDGDERDRTADLLNAIQALSQLSYAPGARHPRSSCFRRSSAARVSGTAQSSRVYVRRQAESQKSHWRIAHGGVSCMAPPSSLLNLPILGRNTTTGAGSGVSAGADGWQADPPFRSSFFVSSAGVMSHPEVA